MALPSWCTATDDRWPWPASAGQRAFTRITFDAGQLDPGAPTSSDGPTLPESLCHAVVKRRADYLSGRIAAAQAIAQLGASTVYPERHPEGQPVWPAGFTGSITHSGPCAAAVVARTSDYLALGLDLEPLMANQAAQRLQARILCPGERHRFQAALASHPGTLITTIFSLKEALFKALFPATGTRFWFQDAEVTDLQANTARLRLNKTLSPGFPAGSQFEATIAHTDNSMLTLISVPAS